MRERERERESERERERGFLRRGEVREVGEDLRGARGPERG